MKLTNHYKVESIDSLCNNKVFYNVTTIQPGAEQKECYCTKGHKHLTSDTELYYCIEGEGIILQEDSNETLVHLISKGSSVEIKSNYFHRLINTGKTELKVLCVGKVSAGHDYNIKTKVRILDERLQDNTTTEQ